MEPTDLNFSPSEDTHLIARLRQEQPTLPDDDFSHRVLAALPPRSPVRDSRSKSILRVVGTALGIALAFNEATSPAGFAISTDQVRASFARASELLLPSSAGSATVGLWMAFIVTAASLLFAFKPRRRSLF